MLFISIGFCDSINDIEGDSMNLNFLGRGSAFNPKEGNNSAYFIENNQLFLIDCGESVFEKLIEYDLLNSIDIIHLMITHTHSDHIGSLGTLVMYSYFTLGKPLNIVMKKDAKHLPNIKKILDGFGCTTAMYNYIDEKQYDNRFTSFGSIRYMETNHCDELDCYGLLFTTPNGLVYYSGDTREIDNVKALIASGQNIDKLYIDTTTANFPGNVHFYIGELEKQIPEGLKSKVYCMHINNDDCIQKAKEIGFNVVENQKTKIQILSKNYNRR